MRGFGLIVVAIVVLALVGGCAYLMVANPTPTPQVVERDIPVDRLAK